MERAGLIASLPYWPGAIGQLIAGYTVATDAEVLIAKMDTRSWQCVRFHLDEIGSLFVQLVRCGATDLWSVHLNGIYMPYCNQVPTISLLPDTPYEQAWMGQSNLHSYDPSADSIRAMWPAYCARMRAFLDKAREHLQL
jgi:hypothetical protein